MRAEGRRSAVVMGLAKGAPKNRYYVVGEVYRYSTVQVVRTREHAWSSAAMAGASDAPIGSLETGTHTCSRS